DSNYSSVAEMVFILNRMMNVNYDPLLATLNLMGMATDTGFFKYSNVSADLFRKVADLIELGADLNFIARTILENKKVEQLRLFSHVLNQMKFRANNRLVYSIVRFEDFERYSCTEEDSSGFVNELRSIRGVEVAILFVEYPKGRIHASMRSKSYYDLTKVASEFNGGGHPRAAGATFDDENMEQVVKKVVGRIERDLTN
ncbi:MAG TPA: bifunctional oligoribonuclease/PAP phosphatase NrnA, partial [Thermotogales bacterium]|nr:bifunctional oligoribonuclease/PAP phosphatase NrnA [Thermotogales bacterium]